MSNTDLDISILIPIYNSGQTLTHLINEIDRYMAGTKMSYEVICVDDGSFDDSWEKLEQLCKDNLRLKGLKLNRNYGQQMALYKGLGCCSGRYVLTMDDDLQHDIYDLNQLLEMAQGGSDLIFGIYETYGTFDLRLMGSKIIGAFFKWRFPKLKGNRVSAMRLISKSVYKALPAVPGKFVYLSAELIPYAKTIGNVQVKRRKRVYGKSGYTFIKCAGIALKLVYYYGRLPLRFNRKDNRSDASIDGWCGQLPNQWY